MAIRTVRPSATTLARLDRSVRASTAVRVARFRRRSGMPPRRSDAVRAQAQADDGTATARGDWCCLAGGEPMLRPGPSPTGRYHSLGRLLVPGIISTGRALGYPARAREDPPRRNRLSAHSSLFGNAASPTRPDGTSARFAYEQVIGGVRAWLDEGEGCDVDVAVYARDRSAETLAAEIRTDSTPTSGGGGAQIVVAGEASRRRRGRRLAMAAAGWVERRRGTTRCCCLGEASRRPRRRRRHSDRPVARSLVCRGSSGRRPASVAVMS